MQTAVQTRYAAGAHAAEPALCCPVDYDPRYLKVIPAEVIERDYGCGDPSRWLRAGETVLDLGSGTGKIAFIASQIVGPSGRVIGIDMTDDMLAVARQAAPVVAERIGYANVEFRKGRIQDLALDLSLLDTALAARPLADANDFLALEDEIQRLRQEQPLVASDSVDVVVSNCVLNLVGHDSRTQLFREIYRVLKKGGRAVISDIVCDEDVPLELQKDATLWSGCLSGAFREDAFLQAFVDAGFHGVRLVKYDDAPWQTIEGIEFRSVTIEAFKGKEGPCWEKNQAVIYKGPFQSVSDDDGHTYERGQRYAVCEKTFHLYMSEPYAGYFQPILPREPVPADELRPFDCTVTALRSARQSKGMSYQANTAPSSDCCAPGQNCC
jgi:arsenite methyltransferase